LANPGGIAGFLLIHATYAAVASVAAFTLLSALVGWLPMKWGLKHLENFET
jgi:hypothetical protein